MYLSAASERSESCALSCPIWDNACSYNCFSRTRVRASCWASMSSLANSAFWSARWWLVRSSCFSYRCARTIDCFSRSTLSTRTSASAMSSRTSSLRSTSARASDWARARRVVASAERSAASSSSLLTRSVGAVGRGVAAGVAADAPARCKRRRGVLGAGRRAAAAACSASAVRHCCSVRQSRHVRCALNCSMIVAAVACRLSVRWRSLAAASRAVFASTDERSVSGSIRTERPVGSVQLGLAINSPPSMAGRPPSSIKTRSSRQRATKLN